MEEKKDLKFTNVEVDLEKGIVYDISTGEIYNDIEDGKCLLEDSKLHNQYNKAKAKAMRKVYGITDRIEKYYTNWKKKMYFNKVYRVEFREYLDNIKLSPDSALLFLYFQTRLEEKTNKIINDKGKNFSNKEIIELVGLSNKRVKSALSEMEEKLLIKRIGSTHNRAMYMNPYLICTGNVIEIDTVNLFENYVKMSSY